MRSIDLSFEYFLNLIQCYFLFCRGIKPTVNTLRPRSGKEYQNIDRSTITLVQQMPNQHNKSISSNSSSSSNPNYVNITPVPENSESPSPGYQSSTSFQDEFVAIKVNLKV